MDAAATAALVLALLQVPAAAPGAPDAPGQAAPQAPAPAPGAPSPQQPPSPPAAPATPGTAAEGTPPTPPPPRPVTGDLLYTIPLASEPLAAPAVVATPAGALVVLALEDAVEARRAGDGAAAWTRAGLAGAGLAHESAGIPGEAVLGWAGVTPDGPRLLVLAADDGRTLIEVALSRPPVGAPTPGPAGTWSVPLEGARVAITRQGEAGASEYELRTPIEPPLVAFGPVVLAVDADDRRFRTVTSPRHPTGRDIQPATVLQDGRRLYVAGRRSFAAYDCLKRIRGDVDCDQDWRQVLGGGVEAPPLLLGRRLFVPSLDTHLYAFDARNGHLLWRSRTGARLSTTPLRWQDDVVALLPAAASGVLFVSGADGRPIGTLAAREGDVLVRGIARSGDVLIVPVRVFPEFGPALQGWRVKVTPPPPPPAPGTQEAPQGPPATGTSPPPSDNPS